MPASIQPEELVGLLAEGDRLRVFAALVLGHESIAELRRVTDLSAREVGVALTRLVDSGLVAKDRHGYHALESELRASARDALQRPDKQDAVDDDDRERARVLRAFLRDGRLQSIPASHGKRQVILDVLAQDFEPGRRYTEKQVNLVLGKRYADTAALRRYLVDDGYLEREGGAGRYWRAGGTFAVDDDG